jgi:hypothetical protein
MKLKVFLSWLNNGSVINSTEIVEAPFLITEESIVDYIRNKVSSVGFEEFISLSWKPTY